MELFAGHNQTYKTRENAVAKLRKHVKLGDVRWMIAVNDSGRYFPVVSGTPVNPKVDARGLVFCGICVVG